MKIDNKIENLFSGNIIFAAYIFLIPGCFILFATDFSTGNIIIGSLTILVACFVIFTSSHVEINTSEKQIKQYYKLFGLIKTGQWKSLDNFKGVTLVPMSKIQGMASLSNRTTTSIHKDYRVFLVTQNKRPAFAIKTCKKLDDAQDSLDEFSIWLKMPVFSVKK